MSLLELLWMLPLDHPTRHSLDPEPKLDFLETRTAFPFIEQDSIW